MAQIRAKLAPGTPIEVWCQDEMRVGQKNKLTYRWARKGSRPRATHDQRTESTYLFGAVCPERGTGAALVLPACNSEAMQLHLDEIATKVTSGGTDKNMKFLKCDVMAVTKVSLFFWPTRISSWHHTSTGVPGASFWRTSATRAGKFF